MIKILYKLLTLLILYKSFYVYKKIIYENIYNKITRLKLDDYLNYNLDYEIVNRYILF